MSLSIESIGTSAVGNRLLPIRRAERDLMRDPEMVFEVHAATAAAAEPLSFQNDYMGILQDVYRYDDDGQKTG